MTKCRCGKGGLETCCMPFLLGKKNPSTPEELMRSRYSAFALKKVSYIDQTMKGLAKKGFNRKTLEKDLESQEFVSLEVLDSGQKANEGFVEFQATVFIHKKKYILHEKSYFLREKGKWFYVKGEIRDTPSL